MIHTTEQARELWCPMANGIPAKDGVSRCMGSKCAMWRWSPEKTKKELQIVPNNKGGGNEIYVDMPTHGYCGLAGQPEVTT